MVQTMGWTKFSITKAFLSRKLGIEISVQWPMLALAPYTQSIAVTSALLAPHQSTQRRKKKVPQTSNTAACPHSAHNTIDWIHCTTQGARGVQYAKSYSIPSFFNVLIDIDVIIIRHGKFDFLPKYSYRY